MIFIIKKMSSHPRIESDSSISSTKSTSSSIVSSKGKCLYKKEFLSSLQKLPIPSNNDEMYKNLISKNNFPLSEQKDKVIIITPLKNSSIIPFTNSCKKNNINISNYKKENKIFEITYKIDNITIKLEELFIKIKDLFCECQICINECEEFIELLNKNFDFILEKTNASEYMPLINNSMNIIYFSIILIYCLSNHGKYYLFKFDTNIILENCKNLSKYIFEKCRNKNDINFKEKSNSMTNLYKNISNSLNSIISNFEQVNSFISKKFYNLNKNLRRINHKEIYNFYNENINKNNKKINEFILKSNENINKANKTFSSQNLTSINPFKNLSSEKNLNNDLNVNNINSIDAVSINGIIFPYKKRKSQNYGNLSYKSNNYNKNIYHTIEGNLPDSHVKIIINENIENKENDYNQINNSFKNNSMLSNNPTLNLKKTQIINQNSYRNSFLKNINLNQLPTNIKFPLLPIIKNKNYTLIINLDDCLIHNYDSNKIIIRNGLKDFLFSLIPYYELISYTNGDENYSNKIISIIDEKEHFFKYNLHKGNSTFLNEKYYKDFNKLGRNIKKCIIIEDINNNLGRHNDNTILIKSFIKNEKDNILKKLSNILINIVKDDSDDVRKNLKMLQKEIKDEVSGE